jgi:hypothetical protein
MKVKIHAVYNFGAGVGKEPPIVVAYEQQRHHTGREVK